MSIFFDRPNGEVCVMWIVKFSIFVWSVFRYMFGLVTVHILDIFSDATQLVSQRFFVGRLVVSYLRMFRWWQVNVYFRYIVWCHTVSQSVFLSGVGWWVISVCFGDGRWMLWLMCNMKLLIICGVCSCRFFRKGVGSLLIITSKFCGVPPANVLDMVPCVLLTNLSIYVGHLQWLLFSLRRAAMRGWIITTFCWVGHGEFPENYISSSSSVGAKKIIFSPSKLCLHFFPYASWRYNVVIHIIGIFNVVKPLKVVEFFNFTEKNLFSPEVSVSWALSLL